MTGALRLPLPRRLAGACLAHGDQEILSTAFAHAVTACVDGTRPSFTIVERAAPDRVTVALADADAAALWAVWTVFVERLRELVGEVAVPTPGGDCVTHAIRRLAEERGSAVAIEDDRESFTYARLAELARAASGLDGVVGIVGTASARFFAAAAAVMGANCAYLPLDARQPADRLLRMVRQASCRVVIDVGDGMPDLPGPRVVPWADLVHGRVGGSGESAVETPAYVMFTSGSTGVPRGAVVGRSSLWSLCRWVARTVGLTHGTVVSQVASVSFDASALEVWPALAAGARVCVAPHDARLDPFELVEWLADRQVEYCFSPTPMAELVMRAPWPPTAALRALGTGGDRLHAVPSELPFRVLNQYGPTECTIVATAGWVEPGGDELPPIGLPLPFNHHLVVSESGSPLPPGTEGELWIGGTGVGLGYVGDLHATRERFVPNPHSDAGETVYRTGDIVRERADGRLEFVGRRDRQVKISGARVELGDVEATVRAVPGVVTAVADPGERRLVVFVVAEPDTGGGLVEAVRAALPTFLRYSRIVVVDTIPLNHNGKTDLATLRTRVDLATDHTP
ncbi:AMP-binding protein [Actinophytocola oryzae]|uniref:Amino acid adenylation domain-containing protein n=1 Tax=Actinophytocola oryzae TaxID=502181 RepID=A0A4R7VH72_9PSEU|nr:AMP-binding protein [Actinophytocola oryzae]TDV48683.1 amino acid adenylation domain-containing protein [Actinophytocola oryzae]